MNNKLTTFAVIILSLLLSSCGSTEKKEAGVKLLPVSTGKEFQYIDTEGKIVINPQFSEASLFRDGLALVSSGGDNPKVGFIDESGMYKIQPQYLRATPFSEGLAWVISENGAPTVIDKDGAIKFTLKDAQIVAGYSEGLAAFSVNDTSGTKWGFVDKSGAIKINPQFQSVGQFSSGLCPVANSEGKWGYIDESGLIKVTHQFEFAGDFTGDHASVKMSGKYGLIDETGKFVINPQYSFVLIDGDMCLIEMDGKFGWADLAGKIVINPQFERAFPFGSSDLAPAKLGNMFGYIESDGKAKINPQFDFAYPFIGDYALIKVGGKFGLIDEKGTYVVNPQFEKVSKDMLDYFTSGDLSLGAVETDFFDVEGIASSINVNSWEGLTLNSTAGEIAPKIIKNPYSSDPNVPYSEYTTEYMIIRDKEIGKEASLSFGVQIKPYKQEMDGWYPTNVYDPMAKPMVLAYSLNLKSSKAVNKSKEIADAILSKLNGWIKNEEWSTERELFFTKGSETLLVETGSSKIVVGITSTDIIRAMKDASAMGYEGGD